MKTIGFLFIGMILILAAACSPETAIQNENSPAATPIRNIQAESLDEPAEDFESPTKLPVAATATVANAIPEATFTPALVATLESEEPQEVTEPSKELPLLPPFQEANADGIGEPLLGGEQDPFAEDYLYPVHRASG